MAVIIGHDLSLARRGVQQKIWWFTRSECVNMRVEGVEIDSGNEAADDFLRQIPDEVLERIALRALTDVVEEEADIAAYFARYGAG